MPSHSQASPLLCLLFGIAALGSGIGCRSTDPSDPAGGHAAGSGPAPLDVSLTPLFREEGLVKAGWTVREWDDVARPPHKEAHWFVREGILHGTGGLPDDVWIGTWLLSEKEYENFVLDFDFHLGGPRGNGGVALRAPFHGDPAFDGMELQLTDEHYQRGVSSDADATQMTGAIYLGIAPLRQAYRPDAWNHLRIELRDASLRAWLNGTLIHDVSLDRYSKEIKDPNTARVRPAIASRPARGRIGFQDLSGDGNMVRIRNPRFAELPGKEK